MARLQLPIEIGTLLMTMALVMTSVIAQSGSGNQIAEDLPCREVTDENVDTCYTLYQFNDTGTTNAESMCRSKHGRNGRLAAIPDSETQQWLQERLSDSNLSDSEQLWIGATYSGNGWTWHGDEKKRISFTNWAVGQPVNGIIRCVYIETNLSTSGEANSWKWKTDSCSSKRNFLCEYPDNRCGRPSRRFENALLNRLAGGVKAAEHVWPWMVSIHVDQRHVCGGSLITDRWILTAAHCRKEFYRTRDHTLLIGVHDLHELDSPYKIEAQVHNFHVHPNYTDKTNDIMLLELEEPIRFNHGVKPVCLPPRKPKSDLSRNRRCVATGWGMHSDTSQCCPMWVAQRDTEEEIDGRHQKFSQINTLYGCQQSCFKKKICSGINFHYNKPNGSRCIAILSPSSQRYKSVFGVDHYSIRRACAGCRYVWTVHENRNVSSDVVETVTSDVESLTDCQIKCKANVNCTSLNYKHLAQNQTVNRCEIMLRDNFTHDVPRKDMSHSPGTNYYEFSDFFNRDDDNELRQAILRPVPSNECRRHFRDQNYDVDTMMCAGGDGADACAGDSGGPLVCQEEDGRWVVYGVISWGDFECALYGRPGVYAMVAPHREWINSKTRTIQQRTSTPAPGPDVQVTSQDHNCKDKNPCTLENVSNGWRCFTTSDPNPNKFVHCTTRGACNLKDGSTATLTLEQDVCYLAIRQMRRIARNERGTSGFRIRLGSGRN